MYENVELPDGMSPDTLEHLMDPKNYGKLDKPSCVGVAVDEKTGEYVIFYLLTENENFIKDVRFATNGCQDTVVVGSMFSSMIKDNDFDYAKKAIKKLYEKLGDMSAQQEICANIVFSSFVASIMNYENILNGKTEEMHVIKMGQSCDSGENNE